MTKWEYFDFIMNVTVPDRRRHHK